MKQILKISKKILNVLCWLFIALLVSTVIFSFVARFSGSSPSFFGYTIYRVSSGSMVPELQIGDIILDKTVDNPKELKIGDTITIEGNEETGGVSITHKIIKAPYQTENGKWKLQTKGVANDLPDVEITLDKVKGILVCTVPFLTVIYSIFLSPWGLIIFIALLLVVFIDEIIAIVRIVTGNDKTAKDGEDINEIIDRLQNEKELSSNNEDENNEKE